MVLKASLSWRVHPLPQSTSLLAIDVLSNTPDTTLPLDFRSSHINASLDTPPAALFLLEHLERSSYIRFLLPTINGYLLQADFLHRRLVDCKDVVKVQTFTSFNHHFEGVTIDECKKLDLVGVLEYAIGAFVISSSTESWSETQIAISNEELRRRFSYSWYTSTPTPKRRLAVIRPGSPHSLQNRAKLEDLATTAASLNIELIMFDDPCHGLAGTEWGYLRQDFVPMDMTATNDLSERIAEAVSVYPRQIDGIIGMYEGLLTVVAKAATLLNFPTSLPEAMATARDKYKTRLHDQGLFCRLLESTSDLEDFVASYRTVAPFSLPMIVKPSDGWASEGVFKISSELELRDAVSRIWQPTFSSKYGRASQSPIVVEPYVDGPENDANLVLVDGEIVFFEANDDFPSSGDNGKGGFAEVLNALPSALPESELDAVRRKAHKVVLDMGFRTGVFHVETRVHNSAVHFANGEDGVMDLVVNPDTSKAVPAVFVLEVNPRPPGGRTALATERTYGISYRSLSLLTALGDYERMRALASPFLGGAQYHMQALYIAAQEGGVYRFGDVCSNVFEREPELRSHVMHSMGFLCDGQEVPDPRTGRLAGSGIAFFLVASRESRREATLISERVQSLVREITDGF